jgi:hypothetical protein
MGEDLKKAFLSKNSEKVSELFRIYFKPIATSQSTASEKTFHNYIHLVLLALGFHVHSEESGADGRLDFSVLLPSQVGLVIELKYVSKQIKLSTAKENEVLVNLADDLIPKEELNKSLAKTAKKTFRRKLLAPFDERATGAERDRLLAEFLMDSKPNKADENKVIADAAREILSPDVIQQALMDATGKESLPEEEIEGALTKAAQQALDQIKKNGYSDIIRHQSHGEVLNLGLAIYGNGSQLKAMFG